MTISTPLYYFSYTFHIIFYRFLKNENNQDNDPRSHAYQPKNLNLMPFFFLQEEDDNYQVVIWMTIDQSFFFLAIGLLVRCIISQIIVTDLFCEMKQHVHRYSAVTESSHQNLQGFDLRSIRKCQIWLPFTQNSIWRIPL